MSSSPSMRRARGELERDLVHLRQARDELRGELSPQLLERIGAKIEELESELATMREERRSRPLEASFGSTSRSPSTDRRGTSIDDGAPPVPSFE